MMGVCACGTLLHHFVWKSIVYSICTFSATHLKQHLYVQMNVLTESLFLEALAYDGYWLQGICM